MQIPRHPFVFAALLACAPHSAVAAAIPIHPTVAGQPLGASAQRLLQALEFLGHPLPGNTATRVATAAQARDAQTLQELLDPFVLLAVDINPELRVKVARGPVRAGLVQHAYTPFLVKVMNDGRGSQRLRISSPQGGPVYAGAAAGSLERQQQTGLGVNQNTRGDPNRFLLAEIHAAPPMSDYLGGLEVEYAIALIASTEAGNREATLAFDIGEGTQDIGFRGEAAVLFDVRPAIPVDLSIRDHDGAPSVAHLTIRDAQGRVYPSQPKRLAPDFFFQPQIYRADGAVLQLPPGKFVVEYGRGPEYRVRRLPLTVPESGRGRIAIKLERWVEPGRHGYFSGDHHIHGSGCAHYTVPSEGNNPQDMFLQVKGEGLNVGSILTWGPGFEHQKQFFSPIADAVSEPLTRLKYDLEISGFGSAALGHIVLLNLRELHYPGSESTARGWPTWTVPAMRWAKEQGGIAGYPHSDMKVDPPSYAKRYVRLHDRNGDGSLSQAEAEAGLLPLPFARLDADRDGRLTLSELTDGSDRAANELPNLVLPSMLGSGAMEIFVSTVEGVCDFTSAMDTGRVGEWNTWYHLLNCGFPLKLSGETDFPCMSGLRVGQGRVYVKLAGGPVDSVDYGAWCQGLARGRSYVSDGYAHAFGFKVNGVEPGADAIALTGPATVTVQAQVAFAPELPKAVAYGTLDPTEGGRYSGDTRALYASRTNEIVVGGERLVEIVSNGKVVARRKVPADGATHDVSFRVPVEASSWIALRHFPQLHTNPVEVIIAGKPIRASRESARWCLDSVELLWENRNNKISEQERPAARAAYDRAISEYRRRADDAR